jgi:hypothetical protein
VYFIARQTKLHFCRVYESLSCAFYQPHDKQHLCCVLLYRVHDKEKAKKKKKLFFTGRVGDCCPSLSPFSTQNAGGGGGGACPLDPRNPAGRGRGTDDSKNLLSF